MQWWGVLLVALLAFGWGMARATTWRERRKRRTAEARLAAHERAASLERAQVLGVVAEEPYDQQGEDRPAVAGRDPIEDVTQLLPAAAELPPHGVGAYDHTARLADLDTSSEKSPLYEETLAAIPVVRTGAEAWGLADDLVPDPEVVRGRFAQELTGVEPEQHDRDEGADEGDDPPPPSPPSGKPRDDQDRDGTPVGERLMPALPAGPVKARYGWPKALAVRPPWGVLPSDKLRTWRHRARRVVARLTHPPRVKIKRQHPMWAAGQLTLLMTGEMPAVRVIVRHRRGGGTWAVTG